MYCAPKYWHIFMILHRVLYNYELTHISDVYPCTVHLDTGAYKKQQKYVPVSSCKAHEETLEICASI
jgi:hypothetical protein